MKEFGAPPRISRLDLIMGWIRFLPFKGISQVHQKVLDLPLFAIVMQAEKGVAEKSGSSITFFPAVLEVLFCEAPCHLC